MVIFIGGGGGVREIFLFGRVLLDPDNEQKVPVPCCKTCNTNVFTVQVPVPNEFIYLGLGNIPCPSLDLKFMK